MGTMREVMEKQEAARRAVIEEVARTEAGKDLFRILYFEAGMNVTSMVIRADGQADTVKTYANEARRALYIYFRKFIPKEVLREIEIPTEEKK